MYNLNGDFAHFDALFFGVFVAKDSCVVFVFGGRYGDPHEYLSIPLDRMSEFRNRVENRGYELAEGSKHSDFSVYTSARMATFLIRDFG